MTTEEQLQKLVGYLIVRVEAITYKDMIEQLELTVNDGNRNHYKIILCGNANFNTRDDYLNVDVQRIGQ